MATRHTPGPWQMLELSAAEIGAAVGESADDHTAAIDVEAASYPVLCAGPLDGSPPNRPIEEVRANARLIAAAPDLLAACKRADSLLAHLMKTVDWGKTFDLQIGELNGVLLDLPRAIAKAEGAANLDPKGS